MTDLLHTAQGLARSILTVAEDYSEICRDYILAGDPYRARMYARDSARAGLQYLKLIECGKSKGRVFLK